MSGKPVAAGKSSFDLIDTEKTFGILDVKTNSTFLDLACGIGKYSLEISKTIGQDGQVYAVDLWQEGIEALNREIQESGLQNIRTLVADMRSRLPFEDNSIDACLLATVIHDLSSTERRSAMREVSRLVRPGGMLHIIEFKKIDNGPGPPLKIRLGEEDIEALVSPYGFEKVAGSAVGDYNYLLKYKKTI